MAIAHCRVWKLGGSLLGLPDLPQRVRLAMGDADGPKNLMIVGGGDVVDAVRRLDDIHRFSQRSVHWRCVELLSTTAALASEILDGFELLEDKIQLESWLASSAQVHSVVSPACFYNQSNVGCRLPEDWRTTTDSIAALLAQQLDAELILLKSREGNYANWHQAAQDGFVDEYFPKMADGLKSVSVVNLRSTQFLELGL